MRAKASRANAAAGEIVTSAPGKLFLLGEYAVLDGAPALLTTVDRRVRVVVRSATTDHWQLSTPGAAATTHSDRIELGSDGSVPESLDPTERARLRVFDAVRKSVLATVDATAPGPLEISIDSTSFSREGHKLGLGSSAAVAVALTAALAQAGGLNLAPQQLYSRALMAHRAAQGGTGSGGDIAASMHGGLIQYTRGAPPTQLTWPAGLAMLAVVTGTGSSTTQLVGRVQAYAARNPLRYRSDIGRLARLAGQAGEALAATNSFLRLATKYFQALSQLDDHAGAGIVTQRHRALHRLAAAHGGTFKSSGAGGGDVGLAFCESGRPALLLSAALTSAGARVVPLGFGTDGLRQTAYGRMKQ
ncbi:MAG: hypothetical protein ABI255_04920 [Microbacteriaceae bacterium]